MVRRYPRGVGRCMSWRRRRSSSTPRHAPQSQSAEIQLQLGNEFLAEGRYQDALDAYQRALTVVGARRSARGARRASSSPRCGSPSSTWPAPKPKSSSPRRRKSPEALALYGDALWASGLFEEAEARYRDALAVAPDLARGHHGMARSLAARSQLDEAMDEAQTALRLAPRDLEIHHTVGAIYERMHKYEEAAGAFSNYVNLLPNKDRSEKADWSRSEIKFLRSFGQRVPFEMDPGPGRSALHRRLPAGEREGRRAREGQRRLVPGLRRRHRRREHRHLAADGAAPRHHADHLHAQRRRRRRRAARPAARAHQLARARTLKLRNVPCLIKDPPLRDLPTKEAESLSPLSLGFSMIIDYKTQQDHVRQASAGRSRGLRAAAAPASAGDGPRHGRRHAPGELRGRYRRRGDFDQPRDRHRDRHAASRRARSR